MKNRICVTLSVAVLALWTIGTTKAAIPGTGGSGAGSGSSGGGGQVQGMQAQGTTRK